MLPENINTLSIHELMDILVDNTTTLLELMNSKESDGVLIRDVRLDVQKLQEIISDKKANKMQMVG